MKIFKLFLVDRRNLTCIGIIYINFHLYLKEKVKFDSFSVFENFGDLNNYSRGIDIEKGLYIGDFSVSRLPNKNSVAKSAPFNLKPRMRN